MASGVMVLNSTEAESYIAPCSLHACTTTSTGSSIFNSSSSPATSTVLNPSLQLSLTSITTMTYSSSIITQSSSLMPPAVYITSASSTNVNVNTNPNSDSTVIIASAAAGGVVILLVALVACIMFCCSRKRGGAKVHSTNAVVLESLNSPDQQPQEELDMGNKSGRFSPPEKQNEPGVKGEQQDVSSPDAGNGVAPSPDGTGGSPSSDKTSADKTSPSLDKAEPSTDPSSGAAVGAPDGSEQVVGAPEESGEPTAKDEAPVLKEYEAEVSVIEGKQVILRVEVTGVPQPTMTWKYNDKTVEPDYAIDITRDGALCFVCVELSHSGTYYFTASNASGSVGGQVELKVREEDDEKESSVSEASPSPVTHPVPVHQFGDYVAELHAGNNVGFFRQYQSLPSCEERHTVNVFRMPGNLPKNRFRNIAVYDDNRIVLEALPAEVTGDDGEADYVNAFMGDYINASYIDGYSKQREYIACQGPLPHTVVDFWRLVWQENVGSIVMVTNLKEGNHIKCQQYWPPTAAMQYGPFIVTLAEQQMFADYIIRHLHISLGGKSKKVLHLQFISWPDHGVPEYAGPTLTYLRRVKAESKSTKGTALFHCSAGVGRTGTLLSVDIALEQAAKEGVVDIQHIVTRLREQRMKMVQTHDQYGFIYDAVLESLICGETQIPAQNLPDAMKQLASIDEKHGKSGYEVQFGVLEQVSPKPDEVITITARSFPDKNRCMEFLPSELSRVPLLMEHPGYINAVFANGYKQKRGYIIAQAPMVSTCRDFWKMVYDRKCGVIIMLSQLTENEKEVCSQYWPTPEEGSVTHGEFIITAGSVKPGKLTQRSFTLVHQMQQSQQQKVTQFELSSWSEEGLCTDPQAILELIERVAGTQRRTGNNPIVLHGIDTVSRCGLLCALTNAIECCKTEGIVDVFQAVKALRIQKPGSVHNVQQYQSIFTILQKFLNSFSIYSNFK